MFNLSMRQPVKYGFTGHETFPFRYGWLKKGIDAVIRDSGIFNSEDAIVSLGVGKNMVRSIRHWCLATQMISEESDSGSRKRTLKVTELGVKLLSEDSWDPYLEDPASLWLIHWLLATNPERSATYYLTFSQYVRPDFTKTDLHKFLINYVNRHSVKVSDNTLLRDVDCFLKTYVAENVDKRGMLEDSFSCPLVELGIIQNISNSEIYRYVTGPKLTLPAQIFGYCLLKFISTSHQRQQTISIKDALYREGSPGQVFRLDENSLFDYIEQLRLSENCGLEISETAGLKQIYFTGFHDPMELLEKYYN